MPYKSKAQQGFFHTAEGKKKVGKKVVDEFDQASKGSHGLPEHVVSKFAKRATKSSMPGM
jgi:hypothetical protein